MRIVKKNCSKNMKNRKKQKHKNTPNSQLSMTHKADNTRMAKKCYFLGIHARMCTVMAKSMVVCACVCA